MLCKRQVSRIWRQFLKNFKEVNGEKEVTYLVSSGGSNR